MRRTPTWVRAGVALVVLAYVTYSLFGIAAPVLWGHHGYHAATYMLRAIMTLRFHVITPCSWAGYDFPPTFSWYFHHPIGYHHLLVPFVWLFGAKEWVARGFAASWGLLTIHALWRLCRRWWSPELALFAIAAFVFLPFVTQFSVLLDAQFPAMACTLYALDNFLRYLERPERKWLVGACAAFVGAGLLMWDGYFQAFFHGLWALAILVTAGARKARLVVGGRPTWINASLAWLFATGFFSALTMAGHFLLTWSNGRMADFGGSYNLRHTASFDFVWSREKQWMEILFGKPLLAIGAVWATVFVVRVLIGKARARDQAVWIFFIVKSLYTTLFGEAAAMHEYRVDWFLFFFILAAVDLVDDLHSLVFFALARNPEVARFASGALAVLAVGGYFYFDLPHAWKNLIDSRVRMGTDAVGNYDPDYSKQLFAMEAARRSGKDDFFFVHNNMPRRIEFYFYMDRSNVDISSLSQIAALQKEHPRALLLMDIGVAGRERSLLLDLLKAHPGFIYDHYILVDLRSNQPGVREYKYAAQPMSLGYRFFVSHVYPPMKAVETPTMVAGCLIADAHIPSIKGAPLPPEPARISAASLTTAPEPALCYYDLERFASDERGAADFLDKVLSVAGVEKRAASLGRIGQVLGITKPDRAGTRLFWRVEDLALLPTNAVVRWTLTPDDKTVAQRNPGKPVVTTIVRPVVTPIVNPVVRPVVKTGETPLASARPGHLRIDRLAWSAVPGAYQLRVEVGLPSLPAPKIPLRLQPMPPPITSAALGRVLIP